jgi:FG-GAP repeat protein/Big-like domain-containing protein
MRRGLFCLALVVVAAILPAASLQASWVEVAKLIDSAGAANDFLPTFVAIDGNVAVATRGEYVDSSLVNHPGAAIVFVRSGGSWSQAARLLPSDPITDDLFGGSVAIRGDVIAIGSPTNGRAGRDGAVYVYVRPAGGWSGTLTETARLSVPVAGGAKTLLGGCITFSDDTIAAVGANFIIGAQFLHTVFMFDQPSGGWSGTVAPTATLTASSSDGFLLRLGGSSDAIVAGSFPDTFAGLSLAGKAFVWARPSTGWAGNIANSAELVPTDPVQGGFFGWWAAMDGDTVVVTSSGNQPTSPPKGYVYEKPSTGWSGILTENAQLVSSDIIPGGGYMNASVSGSRIAIGTVDINGLGGAFVFEQPSSGWSGTISESAEIVGPPGTDFGVANGISGTTIVAGSPGETVGSNAFQGVVHVYDLLKPFNTRIRFLVEGPIRVAPGVPVEFPVQVEAGKRAPSEPTGVVLINDGQGQECRTVLDPSGAGSCSLTFPSAGLYRVRARYLGNSEFDDSTSPTLTVHVGQAGGN